MFLLFWLSRSSNHYFSINVDWSILWKFQTEALNLQNSFSLKVCRMFSKHRYLESQSDRNCFFWQICVLNFTFLHNQMFDFFMMVSINSFLQVGDYQRKSMDSGHSVEMLVSGKPKGCYFVFETSLIRISNSNLLYKCWLDLFSQALNQQSFQIRIFWLGSHKSPSCNLKRVNARLPKRRY